MILMYFLWFVLVAVHVFLFAIKYESNFFCG